MAVFRIEKTRDYTVMSNHHLRDMSLSLKAKGLLSLMLSLPENWDYTMKGLSRICKDGIDSISGGIRELEEHGYLIRERVRGANGQLGSIEYTILEQPTGCAIVLIGHLNKAAGTQSTYRGLGSIDITAAVRSLLFIGKLKDSPTMRVLIHEKSSLAPPGQSLAFSLGDEKGFEWIGAYDITADELLAGTDSGKTESKTAQAQMLILELLADGKRMPSAELEKAVNERGISSRTMRTAKSRIGDRLVTEKDGTAWVCYLRN